MIEAVDLGKKYGDFEAVKGVSFEVGMGRIVGLLGPNGAGKTTIMKILTGYHYPTSGKAIVGGIDVADKPLEVKKLVGYLPETVPLYDDLTVAEYLGFIADAREIPQQKRFEAFERVVSDCEIADVYNVPIIQLSKGYRQRVGLAQAIIHDPSILILDEPTSGLDPNQIIEIRDLITKLGKDKTVILSTHILQEVEAVCKDILILNQGEIAAKGTREDIAKSLRGAERYTLSVKSSAEKKIVSELKALGCVRDVVSSVKAGKTVNVEVTADPGDASGEEIFLWARDGGYVLLEMSRKRVSLEEIFVKLTREGDQE